jgi:hypothetical protein
MSRRWFYPSTPSASPDPSTETSAENALATSLMGDLSRRLFGKRLLIAIPVAAALLADTPKVAQAGTDGDWALSGNAIPDTTKFLGTTSAQPLLIKTNNAERLRVLSNGNVGVGLTTPSARLHVKGTGTTGLRGETSATTTNAAGVLGQITAALPDTFAAGVRGQITTTTSTKGYGVYGSHGGGGTGVYGTGKTGVQGSGTTGVSGSGTTGVFGSGSTTGVLGSGPTGVSGSGSDTGVYGSGRYGVVGDASGSEVTGVLAQANGTGGPIGVWAHVNATDGGPALAGYFGGDVKVFGTLTQASGSLTIDHPLDPANKTLSHSFVESPDMMNVYNGNVTTDASGDATVTLPAYFEALNHDFRYQLTVIGQFAQAIVASKIEANQFTIKTDKPNVEVSWQVTGIRQDAWAEAHRIPVEEDKSNEERGTYLTPKEHGQPESKGHNYERLQRLKGNEAK